MRIYFKRIQAVSNETNNDVIKCSVRQEKFQRNGKELMPYQSIRVRTGKSP